MEPGPVCYCFLFRHEPREWAAWWGSFLQDGDRCSTRSRAVIHSKRAPRSALAQALALPRVRVVPTAWGHLSLVHAAQRLYAEALARNGGAQLFCLLSESCVPLRRRADVERALMMSSEGGVRSLLSASTQAGDNSHEQWCVLTRPAAMAFVAKDFGGAAEWCDRCADEHAAGVVLTENGMPWLCAQTTLTFWAPGNAHPNTVPIDELSSIAKRAAGACVFLRKVDLAQAPPAEMAAMLASTDGLEQDGKDKQSLLAVFDVATHIGAENQRGDRNGTKKENL